MLEVLKVLPGSTLVKIYNHYCGAGKSHIKKFENKDKAISRTLTCLTDPVRGTPQEIGQSMLNAGIITPDEAILFDVIENKAPKKKQSLGLSPRKGLPGPNGTFAGKKLFRKIGANPRRPGTHGWKSFELIRDGMTYEEYRLAGGRSNDLHWDVEHKYVEVR